MLLSMMSESGEAFLKIPKINQSLPSSDSQTILESLGVGTITMKVLASLATCLI